MFTTSVGKLHGKQAVVRYFLHAGELVEFRPFERPPEYFANGDRVVIVGEEASRVRASGVTARTPWAWVHELRACGFRPTIAGLIDLTVDAPTTASGS